MRILYGTIENADAQAKQRIRDYRTAAEICPKVADIINAFDNKVYNSRFDKALAKNTDNRVHVEKRYGGIIRIYTFPEHGYSFDITLATLQITDMPDGKRLSADKLLASHGKQDRYPRKSTPYRAGNVSHDGSQGESAGGY